MTNETKPTASDLRLEIAARTARAPAPAPATATATGAARKRTRRTDEQRIEDLAQRIESLRAQAARPKAAARPKSPRGPSKAVQAPSKGLARTSSGDPFEAELRALVDDFVGKLGALLTRRTLERATQFLGTEGVQKGPRR